MANYRNKTVQPACLHGCIFLKSDASLLYQFNCLHVQADTKFLGYPISLDCTYILARWSAYVSVHYDTILHRTFVLLYCCELCMVLRFYCISCSTYSVLEVGCVRHDRNIYYILTLTWDCYCFDSNKILQPLILVSIEIWLLVMHRNERNELVHAKQIAETLSAQYNCLCFITKLVEQMIHALWHFVEDR